MKKFLSIMLAVLMLVPMLAIGVVADTETCTVQQVNCAKEATFSFENGVWCTRKDEYIDGKKDTAISGNWYADNKPFTVIMSYDEARYFTSLVLTVNGLGNIHGLESQPTEFTNKSFDITVTVYDANMEEIFNSGAVNTYGQTELTFTVNAEAKSIKISYPCAYDSTRAIWEIEAFEQVGEHAWEYDSTVASTCVKAGYDLYKCSCTETMKETLPLRPYHVWDNGTISKNATETDEGKMIYKCVDCKAGKKEVVIPATVHNAWDEGVVTAPTCIDEGYTTYTCTHCSEGVTKLGNFTNPIGHDLGDEIPISRPTFTSTGKSKYECQRPDCDYVNEVDLPMAKYIDSEFKITADDATLYETDMEGNEPANKSEQFPPSKALDGIILEKDLWKGENTDNYWKADISTGGKLVIDLDYEYIITGAKIYAYGNYLTFEIEAFDAEGNAVMNKITMGAFQTPEEGVLKSPVSLYNELFGKKVKQIVITAKNDHNKTVYLSEIELTAHACLYDEKSNVVSEPEKCKETFDGTCWMCGEARTGITQFKHSYGELVADTEPSCYENGAGTKTCTVCSVVENLVIPATGNHDFENGQEKVVTANNCGTDGEAYKMCATPGCPEKSENYVLAATGDHKRFDWKELEGQEADYTHEGVMGWCCTTCMYQDESEGTKASETKNFDCVKNNQDWTIRYTGYVSPRATFKIDVSAISDVSDDFSVKVFGIVKKGDDVKEVQVYGDGATGVAGRDGLFSLVVKDAGYSNEYEFSVRVEIESLEDGTKATTIVKSRAMSTNNKSTVSAYDVAVYYLASANRAGKLDAEVKKLYETIKASKAS